jgi:hypothetical protein
LVAFFQALLIVLFLNPNEPSDLLYSTLIVSLADMTEPILEDSLLKDLGIAVAVI